MRTINLSLLVLALNACIPRDTVTSITIRDPSQIAMEAGPEREEILPPGTEPREALLDEGRIQTGSDTASDYSLTAIREADGSYGLRWDTKLALQDGELQSLWPADRTFVAGGKAAQVVPQGDKLRFDRCASLHRGSSRWGGGSFYASTRTRTASTDSTATPWRCLAGTGEVPFSLSTPWSNVVEIREKSTTHWKSLSWMMLPVAAVLVGTGAFYAARPDERAAKRVAGAVVMGLGFAVEIPLLPSMFTHDRDVSIPVPR
jgi:hypothetical protein